MLPLTDRDLHLDEHIKSSLLSTSVPVISLHIVLDLVRNVNSGRSFEHNLDVLVSLEQKSPPVLRLRVPLEICHNYKMAIITPFALFRWYRWVACKGSLSQIACAPAPSCQLTVLHVSFCNALTCFS